MSGNGKLIARATARAYASAIAAGADEGAAFEAACALYRYSHPRVREDVLRHIVAALISHAPIEIARRNTMQLGSNGADGSEGDIVATQDAYIAAIARGAKPHVAFDVARAAYRARHPALAGDMLDDAVARALATDTTQPAAKHRAPGPPVSPRSAPSTPSRAGR